MRQPVALSLIFLLIIIGILLSCSQPNQKAPTGTNWDDWETNNQYPHLEGWKKYASHGIYTLNNDVARCAECHGVDFSGNWSKVSCYDCHQYPHADDWSSPYRHGKAVIENEGPSTCAGVCHGVGYDGGDSKVSCFDCHQYYPHPKNWLSGHGNVLEEGGFDNCKTKCHGEDLTGGLSGISCWDCHEQEY